MSVEQPEQRAQIGNARQRLEFVDTLRAIAAMGVVAMHVGRSFTEMPPVVARIVENGSKGVQLFFIASAFTMFLTLSRRSGTDRLPVLAFAIRRLFRIAPMYYVALVLYYGWEGGAPHFWCPNGVSTWQVALVALFAQGWHPYSFNAVVPGGWSVAVEMSFYALVPLLFARIKSVRRAVVFLLLAFLIAKLASRAALYGYGYLRAEVVHEFAWMFLPGQLPVFALGFVAYYIWMQSQRLLAAEDQHRSRLRIFGAGLVALWCVGICILPDRHLPLLPSYLLYSFAHAALLVGLSWWPCPVFVNCVMQFIGKVSFSLYLSHFAVMRLLIPAVRVFAQQYAAPDGLVAFVLGFTCVLVVSILVSWVTYSFIEQPCIRLGSRLIAVLEARVVRRNAVATVP